MPLLKDQPITFQAQQPYMIQTLAGCSVHSSRRGAPKDAEHITCLPCPAAPKKKPNTSRNNVTPVTMDMDLFDKPYPEETKSMDMLDTTEDVTFEMSMSTDED